jgi:hypothetical protein
VLPWRYLLGPFRGIGRTASSVGFKLTHQASLTRPVGFHLVVDGIVVAGARPRASDLLCPGSGATKVTPNPGTKLTFLQGSRQ